MTAASISVANLTKREDEGVWHTGVNENPADSKGAAFGAESGGTCNKKKVILLSWDRSRSYIFAGFSIALVIWAAVFFPLIVK